MKTLHIPAHLSHLPVVKGRPVPYITRWTDEHEYIKKNFRESVTTVTVSGWQIFSAFEPDDMQTGEPEWAMVATRRAWESSAKSRCHVCARRISDKDWYVRAIQEEADEGVYVRRGETIGISEQPVCEPCMEFSKKACPAVHRERHRQTWWRAKFIRIPAVLASPLEPTDRGTWHLARRAEGVPASVAARRRLFMKQPITEVRLVRQVP